LANGVMCIMTVSKAVCVKVSVHGVCGFMVNNVEYCVHPELETEGDVVLCAGCRVEGVATLHVLSVIEGGVMLYGVCGNAAHTAVDSHIISFQSRGRAQAITSKT
jgi:hypothetical protein